MTQISVTELKTNTGKYVDMAQNADVLITKNGKLVAKLVTAKPDKVAAAKELFSLLPKGVEVDLDKAREERLSR
jgi:prevent-host-death family protein